MFTDSVKVHFRAGKGGDGSVCWRREKYIPKGGPTGGNGGKGASIILVADDSVYSLDYFRNRRLIRADNGTPGGPNFRTGKSGKDVLFPVPCGTLIKDAENGEVIADLSEKGQKFILCKGGFGGLGNAEFKSATNQAPTRTTPGKPGEEIDVELELKLIADIGLVGAPNAGKSTLLRQITKIPVKIGAYPFTTLKPNLGLIEFDDYSRLLIADIPGLLENAHENKGLGHEFLRHVERTSVLIYVLDTSGVEKPGAAKNFAMLQSELREYNEDAASKPFIVALNKIDVEESKNEIKEFYKTVDIDKSKVFEISAEEGTGVPELVKAVQAIAQANGKRFH